MQQKFIVPFKIFQILVFMDFRKKYFDSFLGAFWAVLSPLMTVLLVYFVFKFGLKTTNIEGVSFLDWLICGMLPWFYISEGLANGMNAFTDNRYLVTKVRFPICVLPIVKSTSSLITHLFIFLFFTVYLLITSAQFNFANYSYVLYYIFCSFVLVSSTSFILSTFLVFTKDISSLLNVSIQLLYWSTPIFWAKELVPAKLHFILLLNPIHYIIQGYRDSLFFDVSIWDKPVEMLSFWTIILLISFFAKITYKKLRPLFADTL